MHWYFDVLQKYTVFHGRASRREYWMFALCDSIVVLILYGLSAITGLGLLVAVYELLVCLPTLAVSVRRLHDIGRSGHWLWLLLVPLVGSLVLLVFHVQRSTPGRNVYGYDPVSGAL